MAWEAVIGLEIHVQLSTRSKIFSGASTAYGAPPNTQVSAIDLGLPGVLPVLNEGVVRMAVRLGLALDAEIAPRTVFARKNYFYPDLPKGYQISQLDAPIVRAGRLPIELEDGTRRTIGVTRAHLEEDAGKSLHEDYHGMTGIDLNRAGVPLLEIVSEPELQSPEEAVAYLREMHTLVRYLGISDGNMNEGSMRCDANVSVRPRGERVLGTRTEIKNVNSFRFVERAIRHEIERQIELRERGERIAQETRLYDAGRDETRSMRSKEHAEDYRYFPDPDLLPAEIDTALIEAVRAELPELPAAKRERFERELELPRADARALAQNRAVADYFETVAGACGDAKLAANWVLVEVAGALNRDGLGIGACPVASEQLATLIARIRDATISGRIAKSIFERLWTDGGEVDAIIEAEGLRQVSDTGELAGMIDRVLADNPGVVEQVTTEESAKKRKKARSFLVGEVMKASAGKANPQQVNALLAERLDER